MGGIRLGIRLGDSTKGYVKLHIYHRCGHRAHWCRAHFGAPDEGEGGQPHSRTTLIINSPEAPSYKCALIHPTVWSRAFEYAAFVTGAVMSGLDANPARIRVHEPPRIDTMLQRQRIAHREWYLGARRPPLGRSAPGRPSRF